MILLDTDVLSETMKRSPSPQVMSWRKEHPEETLFISAITQAEVLFGIALLGAGKRRVDLEGCAEAVFAEEFEGRILPFDSAAAREFAGIAAARRKLGRPISQADCQIAAIARSRSAALATRNTRDFEHCGITIVNPWA